uniref:Carboxyl-terminal-processing peptidase 2ic-like n=1 Tax=Rhizophora mucronata TaxID=61149 RepID=A0A2P2LYX4_RHIMU
MKNKRLEPIEMYLKEFLNLNADLRCTLEGQHVSDRINATIVANQFSLLGNELVCTHSSLCYFERLKNTVPSK